VFKKLIPVLVIICLFSCKVEKREADLIIHNAKIYTVDSSFTTCEALVVQNGKILETGNNDYILSHYTSKNTVDAQQKFVYPGFIDAHCHFVGYGLELERADLVGTTSFNEVLQKVSEFASNLNLQDAQKLPSPQAAEGPGLRQEKSWIIGRGWDQNDWAVKEFPTNEKLDSLFPDQPVILKRIDGHAALANSEALKRAGITSQTKVNGGEIIQKNKKLTGLLVDNAVDLVEKIIPSPDAEKIKRALLNAQKNCLAMGLTTIDDAGLLKKDVDAIDALHKSGELKMRVYAMLSDSADNYKYYLANGPYKTERLNVRSFKFYADGALGSRGACLKKDYSDKKGWKGFLLNTKEHFENYAAILADRGFQMNTHCIGDSSDKIILDIYARYCNADPNKRWRIEHAQVVAAEDFEKFKNLIPSVQPTHATSDMYWAEERLGKERVKYAYAYNDLKNKSGLVALGTDFPVEDISPFKTFYAATIRKDNKGFPDKGFQTENALSREETLKGMTIWAAYSNFEELEKGSLEKGKWADFIILDTDLLKCSPEKILSAQVIETFIAGESVYKP
jgi:predicted amidohydrolase YtcJ